MSRFGAKTYSRREVKSNLQFDQLLSDNKNKPSTAKVSVASVHRWGMASFTSIRKTQLEKQKNHNSDTNVGYSKRKKLEAKVKPPDRGIPEFNDDPFSFESDISPTKPTRVKPGPTVPIPVPNLPTSPKSSNSKPNKFFKSREVKPLAVQNSPVMDPPSTVDAGFKSQSDNRKSKRGMESSPSTKKPGFSKPNHIINDNVSDTHFSETKPQSNFDLMFFHNPDPLGAESPAHSDDSSLPDYFDMPDQCDQTEDPFLPKTVEKLYNPPDYSSEFDTLLMDEKNAVPIENKKLSQSPPTFHSASAPQTRTYTRSRRRVEEIALNVSGRAMPQQSERLPTIYNALPPIDSFSQNVPSTSDTTNSSMIASSDVMTPICLVPKSWSESVSLSQTSDSPVFQLSQESKGTLSAPSLSESQQSYDNDSLEDGRNRGSVFKSKRIFNNPKLKKATYKHRPWQVEDSEETETSSQEIDKVQLPSDLLGDEMRTGFVFDGHKLTLSKQVKPSRNPGQKITSWTCQRKVKELYTVVHNVKQAYQCHESGETQEFNDDVEYLLEGIQQTSSLGTRCLSTLGWASKCMVPSFRIHVRAHGTMSSVYSALADAPKEPSLSLCVATLMFVLSQDRLTMDLEARSLSLMLQLLDINETLEAANLSGSLCGSQPDLPDSQASTVSSLNDSISLQQNSKVMEKVRHLCEVMKQNGYAKQLDLNNITTGNLAMETLLSMTSRKAGEWFKEEIRTLGGLDYIIDTVNMCVELCGDCEGVFEHPLEEELDILRKVDRCLRVLENVTYLNSENQDYLLEYKNSLLLKSCVSLLQVCRGSIFHSPIGSVPSAAGLAVPSTSTVLISRTKDGPGTVFFACIMVLLKVLVNLTNENTLGSKYAGFQAGLMDCVLLCILQTPQSVPPDERFDLLVMALGLLINLMEGCEDNRHRFVNLRTLGSYDCHNNGFELSALEALVELFLNRCDLARQSEEHTDALLDSQGKGPTLDKDGVASSSQAPATQQSKADEMEETLMKALQKAGKNMEHTMIAAYIALLLGCVIQSNEYTDLVRVHLPNENFQLMVDILRKFLNFINLTGSISTTGVKSIQRVLGILESS